MERLIPHIALPVTAVTRLDWTRRLTEEAAGGEHHACDDADLGGADFEQLLQL